MRIVSPEYRSTGVFRDHLREYARKLDGLAAEMRNNSLAQTIHQLEDFAGVNLRWDEVVLSGSAPAFVRSTRWAVGALDVLIHNDTYINAELADPARAPTTVAGCMDFGWSPPASDIQQQFGGEYYGIINLEHCVAAANAQAADSFARLLSMSGYVQLVQLAALCRHLSTEPTQSESVQLARPPLLTYLNVTDKRVPVTSHWILDLAQVEGEGLERTRDCWASVRFKTQPIKRGEQLQYRLVLRTLPDGMSYTDYFRPGYEHEYTQPVDPATPRERTGFMYLSILRAGAALDTAVLQDWTASPREAPIRPLEQVATLKAHTYNWFVPVADDLSAAMIAEPSELSRLHQIVQAVETSGLASKPGAAVMSNPDFGADSAASDVLKRSAVDLTSQPWTLGVYEQRDPSWSAREERVERVQVRYLVDWTEDDLTVSLQVVSTARSLVMCVVLEEQFVASPNIMETAAEVPMDCLLTYVPESFFVQERKATVQAAQAVAKNIPRAGIDLPHPPRPSEVELGLVSPAQMADVLSGIRATQPNKFETLMAHVREELRHRI
ncbi:MULTISPECIES: hypothetical protein [unclassified Rhodanobacter]|uniref:hypothetical protein n=1 Tax=unclassified Rhodanobacter TaxID=2621553 RepID=UPI001BE0639B|nr:MULTISPECIES: hypothetical protein [unclassified Rhodanobacter]MBT2145543.1 hypothetical protein [Rhodanobacter sp. LX-99]MBT2149588.1 hypothetical protein [Rhodanobacter sp. LX-100]